MPQTLCIMPTFQCTAACRSCGMGSHPRDQTRLPLEQMDAAITQAADCGYQEVVFSGGEATLAAENLIAAMRRVQAHGLRCRLVSNAHWARTPAKAERLVDRLLACGLAHLAISTGDEHARFVPLKSVMTAVAAAAARGLPVSISVETALDRTITTATLAARPDLRAIRERNPDASIDLHEGVWAPISPYQYGRYPDGWTFDHHHPKVGRGCQELFSTMTVQANGVLSACCGIGIRWVPDLAFGTIRDTMLAEFERQARQRFLLRWLRTHGPEGILAWASAHDSGIAWSGLYAHRCQACMRVFRDPRITRLIGERGAEMSAEIAFIESVLEPADANVRPHRWQRFVIRPARSRTRKVKPPRRNAMAPFLY